MSNKLKYLLLIIAGLFLIIISSSSYSTGNAYTPKPGDDYYLSSLLGRYSVLTAILFFIAGLAIGYYWKLNPWLTGMFLISIFPLIVIIELNIYKESHNLLGIEFAAHFIYALPAVVGVYIGKFFFNRMRRST
jgi:hypothetical protein